MRKRSQLQNVISIPTYWRDYVNPNIDINTNPKQACPFHGETHGQSFSYSAERGYFSCFGACHVLGGDVVRLHMLNYKIKNYDDAEKSLASLYKLTLDDKPSFVREEVRVSEKDVEYRVAYALACRLAKTVEDYVELDYIMSQYPPSVDMLQAYVNIRKGKKRQ